MYDFIGGVFLVFVGWVKWIWCVIVCGGCWEVFVGWKVVVWCEVCDMCGGR